jgi:hypothetical protein
MGKACIRFKNLEDLPLDVIGQAIKRMPAKKFIEHYEAALNQSTQTKGKSSSKSKSKNR